MPPLIGEFLSRHRRHSSRQPERSPDHRGRVGGRRGRTKGAQETNNALSEAPRQADTAALRKPASPALSLPRLSPEIPPQHITRTDSAAVLTLAEVFLEQGLLQETDWNPHMGLVGSMQAGLTRWLQEAGAGNLQYFFLDWGMTDDIGIWNLNNSDWHKVDKDPATGNVGGLALLMEERLDIPVLSGQVLKLEELAKGAGYSVLRALYTGLHVTIGAWTASAVEGWMENDWYEMEHDPKNYEGTLTEAEFRAEIPEQAIHPKWSQRAINRAKKRLLGRDATFTTFYLAEQIWAVLKAYEKSQNPSGGKFYLPHANDISDFSLEQVYPVVLRWSEKDAVERIFDDWQEMIYNCGEFTDVLYLRCFLTEKREQIVSSIEAMRYAIQIVSLCDSLLGHLDSRPELRQVFQQEEARERVRVEV